MSCKPFLPVLLALIFGGSLMMPAERGQSMKKDPVPGARKQPNTLVKNRVEGLNIVRTGSSEPIQNNCSIMFVEENSMFAFDPVSAVFGVATLAAVIVLGFVLTAQNTRQAKALDDMSKTLSDWLLVQLKDRREAKLGQIHIDNPMTWIAKQCGVTVNQIQRVVEQGNAVDLISPEGCRVVVSTLGKADLMRVASSMSKGVGGQLVEPLLGRSPRKVEPIVRDLTNAGEWFDAEACQVGQMLQVNWGEPMRLYFYVVPLK